MYYPMVGTVIESFYSASFINPTPTFVGLGDVPGRLRRWRLRPDRPQLGRSGPWRWCCCRTCSASRSALLLNQNLPGQGADALAGAAALGAAGRGGRDPVAVHVRSAARPHQFLPDLARRTWRSPGSPQPRPPCPPPSWRRSGRASRSRPSSISRRCRTSMPNRSRPRPSTAPARCGGLFDIVIPAVREVIAVNLVLTTILTFNYFDMIWVLTRGGPQNATHIFPTKIYELGFGQFRFGAGRHLRRDVDPAARRADPGLFRRAVARSEGCRHEPRPAPLRPGRPLAPAGRAGGADPAAVLLDGVGVAEAGRRALRDPGAALARAPDARQLRQRLPARVPHLFRQFAGRVAVDRRHHRDAGAAGRLQLHPQRLPAALGRHGPRHRGPDVSGQRHHHPDLPDDARPRICSTPMRR